MSHKPRYAFYHDVFGGWRWEYYDRTGEAIDSRDSFDTEQECIENARIWGPRDAVLAVPEKYPKIAARRLDDCHSIPVLEEKGRRAA
jgi:hypothetical protein